MMLTIQHIYISISCLLIEDLELLRDAKDSATVFSHSLKSVTTVLEVHTNLTYRLCYNYYYKIVMFCNVSQHGLFEM